MDVPAMCARRGGCLVRPLSRRMHKLSVPSRGALILMQQGPETIVANDQPTMPFEQRGRLTRNSAHNERVAAQNRLFVAHYEDFQRVEVAGEIVITFKT